MRQAEHLSFAILWQSLRAHSDIITVRKIEDIQSIAYPLCKYSSSYSFNALMKINVSFVNTQNN